MNPEELKKDFDNDEAEVKSKLSNIGYRGFQKGTSRIGQVIAPIRGDGQGCEPFSWEEDFTEMELTHFEKSEGFFLLLLRGGCTFGQKVKNAQELGAELVIVSDYENEDSAAVQEAKMDNKLDGTLQSHIPAFEISWDEAKKLVEYIHLGGEKVVYMKANFDVTNSDNTVEVDLWYSTSLDLGLNLS